MSILDTINQPSDMKSLSIDQLRELSREIRERIIETVTVNGGHLASSLGVVELTVALHYVFDTDRDMIVWDVGHQCYAHKLLTGRRKAFPTLRKKGGLSGFPSPSESPFDAFATGHSSTSISAALGMAVARDRLAESHRVIAFIGDGAMTGGMALEALSHAGHLNTDLLVVLNDNEMSISKNVGALAAHFSRLITAGPYKKYKRGLGGYVKKFVGRRMTRIIQRIEASVKGLITPGGLFQEMGFNYIGPIDGHDLPTLIKFLSSLKDMHGPILFHCRTQKGRGYLHAEADPLKYHGVSPARVPEADAEGEARPPETHGARRPTPTFTDAFADALIETAEEDARIVAVTAAMPTGTGLYKFQERFPDRCFDVSICEQHAVTFSAGLAAKGLRPVCAIYSTFFQRSYDQYIHDVCLQDLPVVFAIDRAGLVGEDSPTHLGMFDLSYLRSVPNVTVLAPRDHVDLRSMLRWALHQPGPVAIRYPRSEAPVIGKAKGRDVTRAEVLQEGSDAMLLGVGPLVGTCLKAAEILASEGWAVGVADARRVKPLDAALLDRIHAASIVTVEENTLHGGFGSAVLEYFEQKGCLADKHIRRLGLPDTFLKHATRPQQLAEAGLNVSGIASCVRSLLGQPSAQPVK
jgi:1-deoxy-D-xylulose-5-phosphate synthase